jgi:hypothetical protein
VSHFDLARRTAWAVDPGSVPEALDILAPPGVSQANELDYALHSPVALVGVSIP